MEEVDQYIQKLDSMLDKEQEELSLSKRQHHTDWDSHILTLSTASIGFTFTFLPVTSNNYFCMLVIGLSSFILSVCFATANFIIADIGFNHAFDSLAIRLKLNAKLTRNFNKLKKSLLIAEKENNKEDYETAKSNCEADIAGLFDKADLDSDISKRERLNRKITFLNHAKTYTFIAGILFVVIFSLLNLDAIGK